MDKNTKASEIFKESLTIYQKRFWTFFLIILITSLAARLISYSTGFLPENFKLINRFLTYLITTTITLWGTLSLYETIQNNNIDLSKIFSQSSKKLLPFLILNLFFDLVIFAGLILLIIPGILFMIWFNLAFWIFVDQNIRGNNALLLSKKYMNGNIGYFLKKMIFVAIVSIIPLAITSIIFKENLILNWATTCILSALISPLIAIYGYFIYQNIKNSKTVKSKKQKTNTHQFSH